MSGCKNYEINVFRKFEPYQNIVLLDSAGDTVENNRYTYLAVDPLCTFKVSKNKFFQNNIEKKINIRSFLKSLLKKCAHKKVKGVPNFQCGLSGYVSYDFCLNIENVTPIEKKPNDYADVNIGLFDLVFAFDLKLKKTFLFSLDLDHTNFCSKDIAHNERRKKLLNFYKLPYITHSKPDNLRFNWKPEITKKTYKKNIKKIIAFIENGDIFQTNFTHKYITQKKSNLSDQHIYLNFRHKTTTPFSAYLNFSDICICSYSPERFIKIIDNKVITSPIKGTIKKSSDRAKDHKLIKKLKESKKNLAENLMIVDVLRNDISRICKKGSVKVKELATIKSYRNVHHLVSTITGKMNKNMDVIDVLGATLPGGSVTGAPKIRAMEVISELEKSNRGVYCGAIGYISFSQDADFNIPIRTVTIFNDQISINCGGGIVFDSKPESEFQESIDKISNIIKNGKQKLMGTEKRIIIK